MAMVSTLDVQLDCDEKTIVQPDFIIEILSKSMRKKDAVIKLNKYMNAEVRGYWLADPDRKVVVVYNFESEEYPMIYGFDAKIPVGIFEGKCEIDFVEIYEYVKFLYE